MSEPTARFDRERLAFFSDAVFAIAITLLAIDLRLPEAAQTATDGEFVEALWDLLPRIAAYGLSFAVIGLYWLAHWRRYQRITRVNERFVVLNLLLLATIAMIPFPTSLMGAHGDRPLAVAVYAGVVSLAGILGAANWVYAVRAGLVSEETSWTAGRRGAFQALAVPAVMLASLPALRWLHPYEVELLWLLVFPVQAIVAHYTRQPR